MGEESAAGGMGGAAPLCPPPRGPSVGGAAWVEKAIAFPPFAPPLLLLLLQWPVEVALGIVVYREGGAA